MDQRAMRMVSKKLSGNTHEETLPFAQMACYLLCAQSQMAMMSEALAFSMPMSRKCKRSWTRTQGSRQAFLSMKFMPVEVSLEIASQRNKRKINAVVNVNHKSR